jgi:hypothetical protein
VRAGEDRKTDYPGIFLQGGAYDHFRSLSQTSINDFHARVPERPRNHLRSTVVSVEPGLGNNYANGRTHHDSIVVGHIISAVILWMILSMLLAAAPAAETWQFDNLERIGGYKVTVLGHPKVAVRAIEFNGLDDAIFLENHPLAGAETFTWEVVFRPDRGGAPEQRFFHLQVDGLDDRMLFEIRVIGDEWCLDSFVKSGTESRALLDRTKLHPLGAWYRIAAVYDGRELRNYVDGVLQGAGELKTATQGKGQTSVGVRFNKVNYFKGAVRSARFTRRALRADDFLIE